MRLNPYNPNPFLIFWFFVGVLLIALFEFGMLLAFSRAYSELHHKLTGLGMLGALVLLVKLIKEYLKRQKRRF